MFNLARTPLRPDIYVGSVPSVMRDSPVGRKPSSYGQVFILCSYTVSVLGV